MVAVGTWIVIATGGGESELHAIESRITPATTANAIALATGEMAGFVKRRA
jgi:hypothetical protein